jgi:molybdopterin-guanine dinucleotide biosynthesis protein A
MTKEEKQAEKYVNGIPIFADEGEGFSRTQMQRAYLAGLEAGRPKWYKVADGDLPKIGKPCLVYLANDNVITAKLREDNVWTTNGRNAFENVIAWFEIPIYNKVKELKDDVGTE